MRVSRHLFAAILVASFVAACSPSQGGSDESRAPASRRPTPTPAPVVLTDYPSGFPTVYVGVVNPGPKLLTPVDGGLRHDVRGRLIAEDGTTGTYTWTWVENRIPALATTCGGLDYPALYTTEDTAVNIVVTFPDWGHATLEATDHIVVFQSSRNGSSPVVCDQVNGGTYDLEFTGGPIKRLMSGTWHWEADGHLVFDPAAGASASPSPSESPG